MVLVMKGGFNERFNYLSQRYGIPKYYKNLYTQEEKHTTMIMEQYTEGSILFIVSDVLKHVRG